MTDVWFVLERSSENVDEEQGQESSKIPPDGRTTQPPQQQHSRRNFGSIWRPPTPTVVFECFFTYTFFGFLPFIIHSRPTQHVAENNAGKSFKKSINRPGRCVCVCVWKRGGRWEHVEKRAPKGKIELKIAPEIMCYHTGSFCFWEETLGRTVIFVIGTELGQVFGEKTLNYKQQRIL